MSVRRSALRGLWRAAFFLLLTGLLVPPYLVCRALRPEATHAIARLWCRGCCRAAGLVVRRYGRPCEAHPALLVANHVSYLDVPVIAAAAPVVFIAKREVAGWPLLGFLARIARTVFIDRVAMQAALQCELLRGRLARGESLLLFPEGTSSDGSDLLAFKSSLFEAAHGGEELPLPVPVQPVSLAYHGLSDGTPFQTNEERLLYAWCGDATLLPHLWRVLTLPGAEVILHFHPPVSPASFASRKALSDYTRRQILSGLRHGLSGGRAAEAGVITGDTQADTPLAAGG